MSNNYETREDFIIDVLKNRGYSVGAEIGTFYGEFANHILNNWEGTLYMVDVWRKLSFSEYPDVLNDLSLNGYQKTIEAITGLEDRGLMLRMSSKQAAKIFSDWSLDFVYIDANHRYEYVKEDLEMWYPKIKIGGMLSGHDYLLNIDWNQPQSTDVGKNKRIDSGLFGVNPAVNEFAKIYGYKVYHTKEWNSSWYFFKE